MSKVPTEYSAGAIERILGELQSRISALEALQPVFDAKSINQEAYRGFPEGRLGFYVDDSQNGDLVLRWKGRLYRFGAVEVVSGQTPTPAIFYLVDGSRSISGPLDHDGSKVGFFGVTPVSQPAALTQTYSTADRTLSAYTPDSESSSYSGIDNAQGGSVYAQVSDLNALRIAYENLRALVEDLAQFVNAITDDLQTLGLEQ